MQIKAAVLHELGREQPFSSSRPFLIEDVELDPPGEGEVRIRVVATNICHSDLLVVDGTRQRPLPVVIGHEAAGVVEELGAGVQDLRPGDHVVTVFAGGCGRCRQCRAGRTNICQDGMTNRSAGLLASGGGRLRRSDGPLFHGYGMATFAEQVVLDRRSVVAVDHDLPLTDAALFGCAVMTGAGAVYNTASVQQGQSVVIVGLGSVGMAALLAAIDSGADVIAVDLNDDKLALASEWGATVTFNAKHPDLVTVVQDLTGGGVDHAIESAGDLRAMDLAYSLTAPGGATIAAGLVGPDERFAYPHASLVSSERSIRGSFMGSCHAPRDLPLLIDRFRNGRLPVDRLISGTLDLESINVGFDRLASGSVFRQVILPAGLAP